MRILPMYCSNCGAERSKEARFCSSCGFDLRERSNINGKDGNGYEYYFKLKDIIRSRYKQFMAGEWNNNKTTRLLSIPKMLGAAIVIVVIIIAFAAISSSKSELSIQGVTIGDSSDEIEKKLGIALDKFSGHRYTYNGVEFLTEEGEITSISVTYMDYKTRRNIGVGSTLAELVKKYGKGNLKMANNSVFLNTKKNQIIYFSIARYNGTDNLYDTNIVKGMQIYDLGDRFQEKWNSYRPLEYLIE